MNRRDVLKAAIAAALAPAALVEPAPQSWTVEAWAKINSLNCYERFRAEMVGRVAAAMQVSPDLLTCELAPRDFFSASRLAIESRRGEWVHFAITRDGWTDRMWIDGMPVT